MHLVAAVELAGARLLKHAYCVVALFGREELLGEGTADEFGKAEAAHRLAGAVEAHDPA